MRLSVPRWAHIYIVLVLHDSSSARFASLGWPCLTQKSNWPLARDFFFFILLSGNRENVFQKCGFLFPVFLKTKCEVIVAWLLLYAEFCVDTLKNVVSRASKRPNLNGLFTPKIGRWMVVYVVPYLVADVTFHTGATGPTWNVFCSVLNVTS